jgi:hypothetical protein
MYLPSFYVYYFPNDQPEVDTNPSSPKSSISSEIEAANAELEKLQR